MGFFKAWVLLLNQERFCYHNRKLFCNLVPFKDDLVSLSDSEWVRALDL